jgi:hypothetical protein
MERLTELRINLFCADVAALGLHVDEGLPDPLPLLPSRLRVLDIKIPWYHGVRHVNQIRSLLNQQRTLTSLDLLLHRNQGTTARRHSTNPPEHWNISVSHSPTSSSMFLAFVTRAFDWNILHGSRLKSLRILGFNDLARSLTTRSFSSLDMSHLRKLELRYIRLDQADLSRIFLETVNLKELKLKCWSGNPWEMAWVNGAELMEDLVALIVFGLTSIPQRRIESLELEDNALQFVPQFLSDSIRGALNGQDPVYHYNFQISARDYDQHSRQAYLSDVLKFPLQFHFEFQRTVWTFTWIHPNMA